jgi:hypothetical protein
MVGSYMVSDGQIFFPSEGLSPRASALKRWSGPRRSPPKASIAVPLPSDQSYKDLSPLLSWYFRLALLAILIKYRQAFYSLFSIPITTFYPDQDLTNTTTNSRQSPTPTSTRRKPNTTPTPTSTRRRTNPIHTSPSLHPNPNQTNTSLHPCPNINITRIRIRIIGIPWNNTNNTKDKNWNNTPIASNSLSYSYPRCLDRQVWLNPLSLRIETIMVSHPYLL